MTEIEWDEVPDEVRGAIEPSIKEFLWLLPPWIQSLTLRYKLELSSIAESMVKKPYRFAVISVGPSFLLYKSDERREAIIHELIHIIFAGLQHTVEHIIDGDGFKYKIYEDALECSVSDLAFLINREL